MRNMGFRNDAKILIKIVRKEKRYGVKKLLREFVCIVHAYSRCRYLMTRLIEEWRLFDQQIIEETIKHVFDHAFANKEDTLSISCD